MLKSMRKNLKSLAPALWLVIFAFILSIFFVWGKGGGSGEVRDKNVVAYVGKEKISVDQYINSLRTKIESLKEQFKELDANFIQQLNIPQQALEETIRQELLLQTARLIGVKVANSEIRDRVLSYPVFQKDGKFIGFDEYKKILEWNRTTVSEFEEIISKEILATKTIQILTSGVSVTRDEVWENFKKTNESAELEYIYIPSDKMELSEQPSQEALLDYFSKNKDAYEIPEKRTAEYVFLNKEDLKEQIDIKDPDVQKYYESNKSHFEEPEKRRVQRIFLPFEDSEKKDILEKSIEIKKQLDKGEDFGKLALEFSKDDQAANNGDWGYFEWKQLPLEEQNTIQELTEKQISDPIELEDGVSIIRISEILPAVQLPLEDVRERIETILRDNKAEEMIETRIAQLEKLALKDKSLDVAAQKLGYKIKNTGPLELGEGIDEIDPSGSLSQMLFNMKEREISSPLITYKGKGISQLIKIDPPRPAAFEEVEEKVKNDFISEKKEQKAFERASRIKNSFNGSDLKKLAESDDIEYKSAQNHKREQYLSLIGDNSEIDRIAFSLPLKELSDPVKVNGGVVLLRVLERKEAIKEEFDENFIQARNELLNTKQNKLFQSMYLKMREKIGVKINYDLYTRVNSEVLSRYQSEND